MSTVSDQPTHRAPLSQLAMIRDDFAQYRAEICPFPTSFITDMARRARVDGYCEDHDPELTAVAIVTMSNQFCYLQPTRRTSRSEPDDQACVARRTSSTEPSTTRRAAR